jgi:hypothetical protein
MIDEIEVFKEGLRQLKRSPKLPEKQLMQREVWPAS